MIDTVFHVKLDNLLMVDMFCAVVAMMCGMF